MTMVIKYSQTVEVQTDVPNTQSAGVYRNIYAVLQNSPMFSSFLNMYDQFKIDGAQVKVLQTNSNNTYQNINNPLTIVTAWDRSGLSAAYDSSDGTITAVQSLTYDNIAQYSSAVEKQALFGTTYKTTRVLYPTTILEKGQWVSAGALSQNSNNYDSVTNAVETGTYKFKPIFLLALKTNTVVATIKTTIATFTFDYAITVTFRGLRKL